MLGTKVLVHLRGVGVVGRPVQRLDEFKTPWDALKPRVAPAPPSPKLPANLKGMPAVKGALAILKAATASQVAEYLGHNKGHIQVTLSKMAMQRLVTRVPEGRGVYKRGVSAFIYSLKEMT